MNSGYAPLSASVTSLMAVIGLWVMAQLLPATDVGAYPVLGLEATLLGWGVDPVAWSANIWFGGALLAWRAGKLVASGLLATLAVACSSEWIVQVSSGSSAWTTLGPGTFLWLAAFVGMAAAVGVRMFEGRRGRRGSAAT